MKPLRGSVRKYRNTITYVDGLRFDSKAEAKRFGELQILDRAGEIWDLKRQVVFACEVNGELVTKYIADFVYRTKDGRKIIEDTKGVSTALFRVKAKLMKACHGIEIQINKARAA